MKQLRTDNEKQASGRNAIFAAQRKQYTECLSKIDALIDMRAKGELNEAEFSQKKSTYMIEKQRLKEIIDDTDHNVNKWIENAELVFTFARDARKRFETGSLEEKRQILQTLSQNLTLKDKTLTV